MTPALKVKSLSKTYSNGVKALKDVDLTIESGDFFALLGANGAGKTTLIGIVTGLVNQTGGTAEVFGYDIKTQQNQARLQIGVVPQEFNFGMFEKVIDIIVWQAGYYGITRSEALPRATELLEKLGLGDKINVVARTLSGGMKRRLMIARALIHRPRFLILDEPTAGVDVELRHGMWEYLDKLNSEEGVTILLTTHYLEEVEQMCRNAAIIKQGEIIKRDSVKNLLQSVDKEIYVVESKKTIPEIKLQNFNFEKTDANTLEVIVKKEQDLNLLLDELGKAKVEVSGIRPKGNRLEELFLNILKD